MEGVEFALEDAREFYERALVYVEASPSTSAERQRRVALAGQIYACLSDKGPGDVTLWDETKVVEDWLPNWNRAGRDNSWDTNVNPFVMRGRVQVIPLLSRCKHIGLLDGTHSTPENFVSDSPTRFAGEELIPDGPFWE